MLNLEQRKLYANMVIVYKATRVSLSCSLARLGFQIVSSTMHCAGIRLMLRRARSKFMSRLFSVRAPVQRNNPPHAIFGCNSLNIFKDRLLNYFLA